jgi:hypothetical protein
MQGKTPGNAGRFVLRAQSSAALRGRHSIFTFARFTSLAKFSVSERI